MLFLDVNECTSEPCLNGGSCTDEPDGYFCTCADGWTGAECQFGNGHFFCQWLNLLNIPFPFKITNSYTCREMC